HLKVSFVSEIVIERLHTSIAEFAGAGFMASTGARTIAHVLQDPRFFGYEVFVVGFGFAGFDYHNIAAERHICENLIAAGKIRVVSKNDVVPFHQFQRSIYYYGRRLMTRLLGGRSI